MPPFTQTAIIKHLYFVSDDERDDAAAQTLLEHDETAHAAISILERMNLFETDMKIEDIFQRVLILCVVVFYQSLHTIMNLFWFACILATDFVRQSFVVTNGKPILAAVRCA